MGRSGRDSVAASCTLVVDLAHGQRQVSGRVRSSSPASASRAQRCRTSPRPAPRRVVRPRQRARQPDARTRGIQRALTAADRMTGEMRQAGNVAKFALTKSGQAHVEVTPRSTPVGRDLEDRWIGEYELGGYPRHVTLSARESRRCRRQRQARHRRQADERHPRRPRGPAGRNAADRDRKRRGIAFEGRIGNGASEIRGTIELGSTELPLVLRRGGKTS